MKREENGHGAAPDRFFEPEMKRPTKCKEAKKRTKKGLTKGEKSDILDGRSGNGGDRRGSPGNGERVTEKSGERPGKRKSKKIEKTFEKPLDKRKEMWYSR